LPRGYAEDKRPLSFWQLLRKPTWTDHMNAPQTESELADLDRSIQRGRSMVSSSRDSSPKRANATASRRTTEENGS
jgi:hypothetical protein